MRSTPPYRPPGSEHGAAAVGAHAVGTEHARKVILDLAEHLERFADLHRMLRQAVVFAQRGDGAHVHAGQTGAAEVNRERTGLMGEGAEDFFT